MPARSVYTLIAAFLAAFPAAPQTDGSAKAGEIGTPQWFDAMKHDGTHAAMLKALAGSNGQPVVPPDCTEMAGIMTFTPGNPLLKGGLPRLRVVSPDDRVDNVPRSPFINQEKDEPFSFYLVLKRDVTYDFYWYGSRDEHFATWRVPADAPKQARLVLAFDASGHPKITLSNSDQSQAAAKSKVVASRTPPPAARRPASH